MAATSDHFLVRFVNLLIVVEALLTIPCYAIGEAGLVISLVSLFGALAARYAIYRNQMSLARLLVQITVSGLLLMAPYWLNGVRSPSIAYMMPASLLAGWFFGRRAMAVMAAVFASCVLVLWTSERNGWYEVASPMRSINTWNQTWIVAIFWTVLVAWYLLKYFEKLLEQERDLRIQLDAANAALNDQLIFKTEELDRVDSDLTRVRLDYEKAYPMAMMASTIPGVAHDLNTPVGNTNMAASSMRSQLDAFQEKVKAGALKRSELEAFLAMTSEGLNIIERANARAGELVENLKELSIDQASQRRRTFEVGKVVDEVLFMLAPSLSKMPVRVVRDIAQDLTMDSFPGPFGQVIANLVQNALVHGFEGRAEGTVTLVAQNAPQGMVRIQVQDDGAGMTEEVLSRIFEPYFTTKLGRGGSGVGLSLCQRLVEEVLCGSISVESEPGQGSRFIIVLPQSTPDATSEPMFPGV